MTSSEDRRSARTQKNLKNALLTLLKEKELSKISITEVTQNAQCNRVTFYSHYKDLHALLGSLFDDYLQDLVAHFRSSYHHLKRFNAIDAHLKLPIFEFIYDNQFVFSLILKGEVLPGSQNQFCETLVQVTNHDLSLEEETDIEIPALNYFSTYGSLGLYLYWINQDFKDSPEVMSEKLSYLHGKMFKGAIVNLPEEEK
ncbi:MAG: TetR/AcrR family transcriptional regulator [Candidatus Pristimantibacillus sp.]